MPRSQNKKNATAGDPPQADPKGTPAEPKPSAFGNGGKGDAQSKGPPSKSNPPAKKKTQKKADPFPDPEPGKYPVLIKVLPQVSHEEREFCSEPFDSFPTYGFANELVATLDKTNMFNQHFVLDPEDILAMEQLALCNQYLKTLDHAQTQDRAIFRPRPNAADVLVPSFIIQRSLFFGDFEQDAAHFSPARLHVLILRTALLSLYYGQHLHPITVFPLGAPIINETNGIWYTKDATARAVINYRTDVNAWDFYRHGHTRVAEWIAAQHLTYNVNVEGVTVKIQITQLPAPELGETLPNYLVRCAIFSLALGWTDEVAFGNWIDGHFPLCHELQNLKAQIDPNAAVGTIGWRPVCNALNDLLDAWRMKAQHRVNIASKMESLTSLDGTGSSAQLSEINRRDGLAEFLLQGSSDDAFGSLAFRPQYKGADFQRSKSFIIDQNAISSASRMLWQTCLKQAP